MQGARVRSLVGELRCHMLCGQKKKKMYSLNGYRFGVRSRRPPTNSALLLRKKIHVSAHSQYVLVIIVTFIVVLITINIIENAAPWG